jgi:hypothetical protein
MVIAGAVALAPQPTKKTLITMQVTIIEYLGISRDTIP